MTTTQPIPRCLASAALQGSSVKDRAGSELGTIKDLMIDLIDGRVSYAVLSFGGFLGLGDKLFAVPWSALQYNFAEDHFVLDIDKERLEHAPGFDKDAWPNFADPRFRVETHEYYGSNPYAA